MSNALLTATFNATVRPAASKLVLIALADRAKHDGSCWCGKADIAKRTSLDARTVDRAVGALRKAGLISVTIGAGKNGVNTYKVHPRQDANPATCRPAFSAAASGTTPPPPRQDAELPPAPCHPNPYEPHLNQINPSLPGLAAPPGDRVLLAKKEAEASGTRPGRKPRIPDPIFDAIVEVCGLQSKSVTSSAARTIRNAAKQILEVCPEVSPDEIRRVASNYRSKWKGADLTPSALAKYWPKFINEDPTVEIARLEGELAVHLGNPRASAYHVDNLTPEIFADYQSKTDRLRHLKQQGQIR